MREGRAVGSALLSSRGAGRSAPVEVVCNVDEGLLKRGEFTLDQELRSLLKNFTTQLDIYIVKLAFFCWGGKCADQSLG